MSYSGNGRRIPTPSAWGLITGVCQGTYELVSGYLKNNAGLEEFKEACLAKPDPYSLSTDRLAKAALEQEKLKNEELKNKNTELKTENAELKKENSELKLLHDENQSSATSVISEVDNMHTQETELESGKSLVSKNVSSYQRFSFSRENPLSELNQRPTGLVLKSKTNPEKSYVVSSRPLTLKKKSSTSFQSFTVQNETTFAPKEKIQQNEQNENGFWFVQIGAFVVTLTDQWYKYKILKEQSNIKSSTTKQDLELALERPVPLLRKALNFVNARNAARTKKENRSFFNKVSSFFKVIFKINDTILFFILVSIFIFGVGFYLVWSWLVVYDWTFYPIFDALGLNPSGSCPFKFG